jgi:SAM-dependent methyltransferase
MTPKKTESETSDLPDLVERRPELVGSYLLENGDAQADVRLRALAAIFDDTTFRHLEKLGLAGGWRVWEVGAGGPSVPRWLSEKVGHQGQVVATDINTALLNKDGPEPFETIVHDVGRDSAPGNDFDLVHARLVLVHVKDRAKALSTMVNALRPGGWLCVEDADPGLQPLVCPDERGDDERLANKLKASFRTLMLERGVDLAFGRSLASRLKAEGLINVGADAYFPMSGEACDELECSTVEQIRDRLLGEGLATEEEIERHLDNVRSHRLDLATSPLVSAWGQKSW